MNAAFDWDQWNRDMDALRDAAIRANEIERELAEAHMAMIRDLRAMLPLAGELGA
jgi:hypothetical protein